MIFCIVLVTLRGHLSGKRRPAPSDRLRSRTIVPKVPQGFLLHCGLGSYLACRRGTRVLSEVVWSPARGKKPLLCFHDSFGAPDTTHFFFFSWLLMWRLDVTATRLQGFFSFTTTINAVTSVLFFRPWKAVFSYVTGQTATAVTAEEEFDSADKFGFPESGSRKVSFRRINNVVVGLMKAKFKMNY